nr:hypothetical protein [Tanacetum cinerariifolium]
MTPSLLTLADLGSCVNIIPLYLFKKLKEGLLEETGHVFGLADGTKSYLVGIVRDVEVYIGKLKLLNDFYVIDMKKNPKTPLVVGRGFLATVNAIIDYRKAKLVVGEGITRLVFGVNGIDLGEEEAPYWTTLGIRESYKLRPSSDGVVLCLPDVAVFKPMSFRFMNFLANKSEFKKVVEANWNIDSVFKKLDVDRVVEIIKPISKKEIKDAIFIIKYNKASRPDRRSLLVVLNLMVKSQVRNDMRFKYHSGCKKLRITILFFTDDLLMLCHGDMVYDSNLKRDLDEFSMSSSLYFSINKSNAFFCNILADVKAETNL